MVTLKASTGFTNVSALLFVLILVVGGDNEKEHWHRQSTFIMSSVHKGQLQYYNCIFSLTPIC